MMKLIPTIIQGNSHIDERGTLLFNNDFNVLGIKRIYTVQNKDTEFVRGWQGHKIEQRWFVAVQGAFTIKLICIDNWEHPSKELESLDFELHAKKMDVLHIPKGYVSSIQSKEEGSKLLVMSDYFLGEVQDEYRFDINYFTK